MYARACVCVYTRTHTCTYTATMCFAAFWAWLSIGKRPINLGALDSSKHTEESSCSPLWCRDAVCVLSVSLRTLRPSRLPFFIAHDSYQTLGREETREGKWEEAREGSGSVRVWVRCKCTRSCNTMIVHKRVQLCPVLIWERADGSSSWGLGRYREISVRLNYRP